MEQQQHREMAGLEKAMTALDPEHFFRDWQQGALRMVRAQECMMQGMLAAARAEVRFGQEFMARRVNLWKWEAPEPGRASDAASEEIDRLIGVVREINEELREGFTEAVKLMSEGAPAFMQAFASPAAANGAGEETPAPEHEASAPRAGTRPRAKAEPKSP